MSGIAPISWKKFHKFLLCVGCRLEREKGDHRIYNKEGINRPIVVPKKNQIPIFVIKSNLRTLRISVEYYIEIIKKI